MAATTQKLNYANVPPRATSSRALRNEVYPTNGDINMGQELIFDLPSNVSNTFWDAQSSYVSFDITNNNSTAGNKVAFEGAGVMSAIRKITVEIGGQTLYNVDNFGNLFSAMFDMDVAAEFRVNAGQLMMGSADAAKGVELAGSGGTRKVCFPLVLTPLGGAQKYWPLIGREAIRIRIQMDTVARGLISANTGTVSDANVAITNAKLVQYNLELGSDVMAQVAAASGGSFKIACPSYQHHQASLASGVTSLNTTLGFSMSSLNRIIVLQQRGGADTAAKIGSRSYADLESFSVSVGGVKYPQIDIKTDSTGAEATAELLLSQRALTSWGHDSSINGGGGFTANEPAGTSGTDGNCGRFIGEIDLESQRVVGSEAGLGLVAGLNTIGSTVQLQLNYSGAVTNAHTINVYGEHTILCMLDLNTLTWSIAV